MKKILLLALAVVAIVSCKKNVSGEPTPAPNPIVTPDLDAPIMLSVGGAAAVRTGNQGIREVFEANDQIGVYATFVDFKTPAIYTPDWDKIYFANKPAVFKANTTGTPVMSTFVWGTIQSNDDLANKQFYPSKDKSVYIYAYYPYTSSEDSMKIETKVPNRYVTLVQGKVGPEKGDTVHKMQPDVMWAVGKSKVYKPTIAAPLDTVRRTVALDTLHFQHALAQVDFGVYLMDANASACTFDTIKFKVPKLGKIDITTGKVTILTDGKSQDAKAKLLSDTSVYKIVLKNGEEIPKKESNQTTAESALKILETAPLMVLPMDTTAARGCQLEITVNYSTDPDKPQRKTYTVDMTQASVKAINQGKRNMIYLGVGQTEILLTAAINPWKDNKDEEDSDIEVE